MKYYKQLNLTDFLSLKTNIKQFKWKKRENDFFSCYYEMEDQIRPQTQYFESLRRLNKKCVPFNKFSQLEYNNFHGENNHTQAAL